MADRWDSALYEDRHSFVWKGGAELIDLLDPKPGERILDLGCGTGHLTAQIAERGAVVTGLDASVSMIAQARQNYPKLKFTLADARDFPASEPFDAVFSNAALHWMPDAEAVIAAVHQALKPGGRFVAEMGGLGNIAAIRVALQAVLARYGIDAEAIAASFYPSPAHYRRLLEAAGFTVRSIQLIPRPTPLPAGMEAWLNTFRNGVLDLLPPPDRAKAVAETVELLRPALCDADGNWTADYVRLRFSAVRS